MRITKENIFNEARRCNLEVLKSDLVDQVKDQHGNTPLHLLANSAVKEVLSHPSVDKVKDYSSWTPLHRLARLGVIEILNHPSVDKVKDQHGGTPLHWLTYWGHLTEEDLRKKYPWYKKEIKDFKKAIDEIVNTPDSIKFILED